MRTSLIFIAILAMIAGAGALYLYVTTPHETVGVSFPLGAKDHAILASVPATAEAFAYIPRAAVLQSTLRRNPITRDLASSWRAERGLPPPWMIGGADLLLWQSAEQTRYLLRLDPIRALVVRIFLMASGDAGGTVLINAAADRPIAAPELAILESLAAKLPPGDALVVQRRASRGAFPPIGRPAVSSVKVTESEITIESRAAGGGAAPGNLSLRFAQGAILSASFQAAPRMLDDLNRLLGAKISTLVSDGGSISLYDIETRKLLPRPIGVIILPLSDERRTAIAPLTRVGVRTAEREDQLVISFDDSIDTYLKDAIDASTVTAGLWAVRVDAPRMAPILDRLAGNVGLRIASPRLFRAARDLDRWIGALEQAKTIEAIDVADGSAEALKVRITAK